MSAKQDLIAHLQSGATTTCQVWKITRKDGITYGFTDHDLDLQFDGTIYKAASGLTGSALQKNIGLSVDNSEIVGALTEDGITELDLDSGRFDQAEIITWLVNWNKLDERMIRFKGTFGEIQRSGAAFKVELRGLTDQFNRSTGRVYQPNCDAILGDVECKFDLTQPGFFAESSIKSIGPDGVYTLKSSPEFLDHWFERGRIRILTGSAKGMTGTIKFDEEMSVGRQIKLWMKLDAAPQVGDLVKIEAGCDKLANTCRTKFSNFLNFRGFPDVPGVDWVASYPVTSQRNDGGSRSK